MPTSIRRRAAMEPISWPKRSDVRRSGCSVNSWRAVAGSKSERGQALAGRALRLVGGARRDRTVDLYNAIVALSQLSYGPEILPWVMTGGARYNSCPAHWQQRLLLATSGLAVALALVVLDFDLDLQVLGVVGEIVGIRQRPRRPRHRAPRLPPAPPRRSSSWPPTWRPLPLQPPLPPPPRRSRRDRGGPSRSPRDRAHARTWGI